MEKHFRSLWFWYHYHTLVHFQLVVFRVSIIYKILRSAKILDLKNYLFLTFNVAKNIVPVPIILIMHLHLIEDILKTSKKLSWNKQYFSYLWVSPTLNRYRFFLLLTGRSIFLSLSCLFFSIRLCLFWRFITFFFIISYKLNL